MRILGSGKIDDFQKIVLSDKVVKALNVKPGDSILFYRGSGSRQVQMQKAEGAFLTTEVDSDGFRPDRNLRIARTFMMAAMVLTVVVLFLSTMMSKRGDSLEFDQDLIAVIVPSILLIVAIMFAMIYVNRMTFEKGAEGIVSLGGPFSKNRMIGVSKVSSDGHIATTNAYCYPLFGVLPASVSAEVVYSDGTTCTAPTLCVRDNTTLAVYRIRVPDGDLSSGTLRVIIRYNYSDKSIVSEAVYTLSTGPRGGIRIDGEDISAEIVFGKDFQRETFDESLFDPLDEPAY